MIDEDVYPGVSRSKSPKIEVEVILNEFNEDGYWIQAHEDAPEICIPHTNVTIVSKSDWAATLRMSEAKAIRYGLV